MRALFHQSCLALTVLAGILPGLPAQESQTAALQIQPASRAPHPVARAITGKFAEHLGNNIYNGMDAQILRNPTFAAFPFATGQMTPDGVATFYYEAGKIRQELRRRASQAGWPEDQLDALAEAYSDGLAGFWGRVGPRNDVRASPDTASHGQRAQRLELSQPGQGAAQWVWLPAHRTRVYEFEIRLRSPGLRSATVTLTPEGATNGVSAQIALSDAWQTVSGRLTLPESAPAEAAYRFALTVPAKGQLVVSRALLRPADHIGGADPDIIRLLKESRLPLLRWPGGNFVSAYHWEDGAGPADQRPTRPNFAWGGLEPNLFGTGEFVAFCRAVGCEPMICVNAGDGTPAEAARWIEYCNGAATTPMGRLRAAHGHPAPFAIRYWEAGNELWGRWQANWATPAGYVDRYHQFSRAMLAADPSIRLLACGAPVMWGKEWNDTLIAGAAGHYSLTTDHPLVGGNVAPETDPLDVFRDFMAVPQVLERKWRALEQDMTRGGVREPRLAVTELQLFAHVAGGAGQAQGALTSRTLVNPTSLTEALYDISIYHAATRLAPFVELITHSAIVNHGGGLRKERERVYANPCHLAQTAFAEFAGATPVAAQFTGPSNSAPLVLPELRNVTQAETFPIVDALAAATPSGDLLLSIVHRDAKSSTRLQCSIQGLQTPRKARVRILTGEAPWQANSLSQPEAVRWADSEVDVREGRFILDLPPFALVMARVPGAASP